MVQISQQSFSLRIQVCHPHTRTYVRLLGPCFKTGRIKPFSHRHWAKADSTHDCPPAGRVETPLLWDQHDSAAASLHACFSPERSPHHKHSHPQWGSYRLTIVFLDSEPTLTRKARDTTHDQLKTSCDACAESSRQSHWCATISPRSTGSIRFPFSDFRHF